MNSRLIKDILILLYWIVIFLLKKNIGACLQHNSAEASKLFDSYEK
jgi:preprotein translocase subunit Sec63